MGELDLTLNELEVVPGMMPFRVALRTGGECVHGTVENGNGGLVVLTPQDERLRVRPFIVVAFFQGGMFALDNVRPGDYYAFALRGSFNTDEMQNPEYARPYLDVAKTVRLERGSTATVTLSYVKTTPRQLISSQVRNPEDRRVAFPAPCPENVRLGSNAAGDCLQWTLGGVTFRLGPVLRSGSCVFRNPVSRD
jgi:hypothetical protein